MLFKIRPAQVTFNEVEWEGHKEGSLLRNRLDTQLCLLRNGFNISRRSLSATFANSCRISCIITTSQ